MSQISLGNGLQSIPLVEIYRAHCLFTLQSKAANKFNLVSVVFLGSFTEFYIFIQYSIHQF